MSFDRIKKDLAKAEKFGERYEISLLHEDFVDLMDMVDALDRRFKTTIHRVRAADLLRLLPPVKV